MKREPFPFYPLIVAAFPVVSVYSANLAYVPPIQLVRPLLWTVGLTALMILVFGVVLRNVARGAAAATVIAICFFAYSWFTGISGQFLADNTIAVLPVWVILTLSLAALAAWRIRRTKILNVLAAFIGVISLFNLGSNLVRSKQLAERAPNSTQGGGVSTASKPDVFYIILDGHGRTDAIRRAIGYDDTPFIEGLEKRGFYVANRSHANYCQTELSVSSSLNMDFIPHLLPKVKPDTEDRLPLEETIHDNEVARRFKAQGYRFVSVTSGFPPINFPNADLQIGTRWGSSMVESTLLQMTPLATGEQVESQFLARRRNLVGAFENLSALATPTLQPRFVIVHILAPHPPFVFNADGTPRKRPGGQFCFCDASDYTTYVAPADDYVKGYAGQVAWVDNQTLAAVDHLLAGEGPKNRPIIIVQGDHGSKLHLDQESYAKTDVKECFPNLNAYLVPDSIRKDLRPDISPVNSFRVLLHDMFGADLPSLPDRSWYSPFPHPYDFTEVTNRIEPITGHAAPPSPQG